MTYCILLPLERRRVIEAEMNNSPKPPTGHTQVRVNGTPRVPNDGYERGKETEDRFYRICNDPAYRHLCPEWFGCVEWGTPKDDHDGIDFWAVTTLGRIPIQVKSSRISRDKFHAQEDRRHIVCIVVLAQWPDADVVTKTIMEISFIWEALDKAQQ